MARPDRVDRKGQIRRYSRRFWGPSAGRRRRSISSFGYISNISTISAGVTFLNGLTCPSYRARSRRRDSASVTGSRRNWTDWTDRKCWAASCECLRGLGIRGGASFFGSDACPRRAAPSSDTRSQARTSRALLGIEGWRRCFARDHPNYSFSPQ
jgi:hypothetical protein